MRPEKTDLLIEKGRIQAGRIAANNHMKLPYKERNEKIPSAEQALARNKSARKAFIPRENICSLRETAL